MTNNESQDDLSYLESDTVWYLPAEAQTRIVWWNPDEWRGIYGRACDARY